MIQTDLINLGAGTRDTGIIDFAGTGGSVSLRNLTGTGRVAAVNLGPQAAQGTGYSTASLIDLTGNTADVAIGTFATSLGAKVAANTNDLSFDTGTLDILSINMAFAKGTGASTNRITIGGGTVRLGGSAAFSDAGTGTLTLATAGSGELIINGGTVTTTASLLEGTGGTGTATVTLNGGTLNMGGNNIGAAVDTVVLAAQSGTLQNVGTLNGTGGLTKTTAGTLVVSGTIAYAGNTTVSEGTLRQSSANTANDASTVSIAATGATLDLTYAGTDTVNKLFIGGVEQPAGIYGPTGINIPQIINSSGTGTLTVLTGSVAGYSSWASVNGATADRSADQDSDGVPNGVEFFIGGPTGNTTGFTPLPGVVNTAGVLSTTWTKAATYTGAYGTDYIVETSTTLTGVWTPATLGATPGQVVITGNNVKYTFPSSGAVNFARLKVTGP